MTLRRKIRGTASSGKRPCLSRTKALARPRRPLVLSLVLLSTGASSGRRWFQSRAPLSRIRDPKGEQLKVKTLVIVGAAASALLIGCSSDTGGSPQSGSSTHTLQVDGRAFSCQGLNSTDAPIVAG